MLGSDVDAPHARADTLTTANRAVIFDGDAKEALLFAFLVMTAAAAAAAGGGQTDDVQSARGVRPVQGIGADGARLARLTRLNSCTRAHTPAPAVAVRARTPAHVVVVVVVRCMSRRKAAPSAMASWPSTASRVPTPLPRTAQYACAVN